MTDKESQRGDPLVDFILAMVDDGSAVLPQEVAKAYFAERRKPKDPDDGWRKYMTPVKQQMGNMARKGLIELVRKRGDVVDPSDYRGVVRMRKPGGATSDDFDYGDDDDLGED